MNNYQDTNIEIIQYASSSEAIRSIKEEISNLKESVNSIHKPERILIADDKELHIKFDPRAYLDRHFIPNFPDELRHTLLAIQINTEHSYIEIVSYGTIRQLEASLPELQGTKIAIIIHAQTKIKYDNLSVEKQKCLAYKPVCRRVRDEIVKQNKRIEQFAPKATLENMLCVPQHALAIASFQNRRVVLGTIGIHACIGLAVINPIKQIAAITHLDRPTIETYKSSLQAMFKKIIADAKDKCKVYLVGGANDPKESVAETNPNYQFFLGSETLACSIMDFLRAYPNIEISTDMLYRERPDAFAVQLDPSKPAAIWAISDKDAGKLEYSENKKLYHRHMIAESIYYQELQEYSSDGKFHS